MLSVIIPVYNSHDYIQRCLDSVVNQTYKDLEIICVDDGSTDDSGKILDDYASKDPRIIVIHKKNGGLSSARNAGMDIASGEYMTFVDSDDWIEIDTYEKCMSKMPSVDMTVFGTKLVGDSSFDNISGLNEYFNLPKNGVVEISDDDRIKTSECVWNKIYSSRIIKENNIRFPDGLLHEDVYFYWVYTFKVRNVYYLPDQKYYYYQRSDSLGRKECLVGNGPYHIVLIVEQILSSLSSSEIEGHKEILRDFINIQFELSTRIIENISDEMLKKIFVISSKYGFRIRNDIFYRIINKYIINENCDDVDTLLLNGILCNSREYSIEACEALVNGRNRITRLEEDNRRLEEDNRRLEEDNRRLEEDNKNQKRSIDELNNSTVKATFNVIKSLIIKTKK